MRGTDYSGQPYRRRQACNNKQPGNILLSVGMKGNSGENESNPEDIDSSRDDILPTASGVICHTPRPTDGIVAPVFRTKDSAILGQ
jgi:hypothetical protein